MTADINIEMERFLRYEDKRKQYSVRVSRECEARIELLREEYQKKLQLTEPTENTERKSKKKHEDEYAVSASAIVRVLVEEGSKHAVELLDENSENKKSNVANMDDLYKEVATLQKQVNVMSQLLGEVCSAWGVDLKDDLNSIPSKATDEEKDGESGESNSDAGSD